MEQQTEDLKQFGERWVYCKSHLRPHTTGWCTVGTEDKVLLDAGNRADAYAEARAKGFKVRGE